MVRMTVPEPTENKPNRSPVPAALKWLTVPLLIALVSNAISLLVLPFAQENLIADVQSTLTEMGMDKVALSPDVWKSTLWTVFFMLTALTALLYFTREGVKEGKGWAWIMSILIGVFSLLNLPLGPIVGIALLYGAFRPEVRAYFGR